MPQWLDIENSVSEVIKYSQNLNADLKGTHDLITRWSQAKEEFYYAMGKKLIIEFPEQVTFTLDEEEKEKELKNFIEKIENYYGNNELALFIKQEKKGFYDNVVTVPYEIIYNSKTIPTGTKLLKAFKYFEPDNNTLHKIQDEASMVIQNNKLTGTLCVSIHPLDYLSSSETTYKWRSCHSLDGDYRSGNLDYMCDEATVVCYLRGNEDVKLLNFPPTVPWNSKKWRMLLYFNDDKSLVMAGRQYPFSSTTALNIIKEKILPMFMGEKLSEWHNDTLYPKEIKYKEGSDPSDRWLWDLPDVRYFIPYRMPIRDNDLIRLDDDNSLHYDDLSYSHIYTKPYYLWNYNYDGYRIKGQRIHLGAKRPKCLVCGSYHIMAPHTMLCKDCYDNWNGFDVCDCCGRRIESDENIYTLIDGSIVCEHCRDEYVVECRDCGRLIYYDNAYKIKETHEFLCYDCVEE